MNNYTHLTLTDRCTIERCLSNGYSFKEVAGLIGRHTSTVSREIQNHRTFIKSGQHPCANFSFCRKNSVCGNDSCTYYCKSCKSVDCSTMCTDFTLNICPRLNKAPYTCINCSRQNKCRFEHAYYHAQNAHALYLSELSESRKGVHTDDEQLAKIDRLVSPLIKKGQSVNHIFVTHSDELMICKRTMYNYIDNCLIEAKNIDLPRKVRYKPRKKKNKNTVNYQYRVGRTYEDFKAYMSDNPELGYVEMDTVKGKREKGKCLLTMIFTKYDFMLIFLLDNCSQACVEEVFDFLWNALGVTIFHRLFPVILTDNGGEFKNPYALENSEYGIMRTKIFYCDPMASYQKPHIERNHEYIRQVIPKGKSFDSFTQNDITKLTNHINSFIRESLNMNCPYDMAKDFLGPKTIRLLDLRKIKPDDVTLRPSLLR